MIRYTLFCVILLIVILVSFYLLYNNIRLEKEFMSTKGFILVKVDRIENLEEFSIVYLKNNCSELSFHVSPDQIASMRDALLKKTNFRPMTHELLVKILERSGMEPRIVRITMLSEGIYFGELRLVSGFRFVSLDIRPSDGVIIALRTDTPIYVNESLIKKVC